MYINMGVLHDFEYHGHMTFQVNFKKTLIYEFITKKINYLKLD
jgi:hypothetical protein